MTYLYNTVALSGCACNELSAAEQFTVSLPKVIITHLVGVLHCKLVLLPAE